MSAFLRLLGGRGSVGAPQWDQREVDGLSNTSHDVNILHRVRLIPTINISFRVVPTIHTEKILKKTLVKLSISKSTRLIPRIKISVRVVPTIHTEKILKRTFVKLSISK